jgi:hypothetical protein
MALDIDGFDVLRRIGGKPKLFAKVAVEAKEFARKLVIKQIEKIETLKDLKAICKGLGKDTFVLLSDSLSDAAVRRIVKLSDPYQPDFDQSSPAHLRSHVVVLGSGC